MESVRLLGRACVGLVLVAACAAAFGETDLTADAIMARVAANQDRSEKLRTEYIYQQKIHVATRRTNGKLAREETAQYAVMPTTADTKKDMVGIQGRYWYKGAYIDFHGDPVPEAGSLDGELVHDFRDDLVNDNSKDGLGKDLFPLTSDEQKKYRFALAGEAMAAGRAVYRISFRPKDKDELTWAGEALIDKIDFEPVSVSTKLSRKLPLFVRTMLGTDVPGIGFNVEYRRFDNGLWFPVSFGTEFRLRAVFFINRTITLSLENTGFRHTTVESSIKYAAPR